MWDLKKKKIRMQPFAFTSGTGTACSVHNNSVYGNENTKWVASFQSESVKGCWGSCVSVDWINIFCCPLSRRRRVTLTISKQRGRICNVFRTGEKDNLSAVAVENLPCCVYFFLHSQLWFCWLGEALLTTHLLCLCHCLTWLTFAPIPCSKPGLLTALRQFVVGLLSRLCVWFLKTFYVFYALCFLASLSVTSQ